MLLAFILAALQLAAASPLSKEWSDFQTKHAWDNIPQGWIYHSDAPADYKFDLRIGLKQDKVDQLIKSFYEVSDPAHERYRQHLSKEEINALVAPHPATAALVSEWLAHHDLPTHHSQIQNSFLIIPDITISQAEKLLNTKYAVYYHKASDSRVVRTTEYSIPSVLVGHVEVVAPTTYFGTLKSMRYTSFIQPSVAVDGAGAQGPVNCSTTITPACLRSLYKTSEYVPSATKQNSIGVVGFLDQYANRADLQTFFEKYRPDAVGHSYTTVLVNKGGDDQKKPGIEANLDIQYTEGITFPTPNIYYSTGGSPPFKPDSATPTNTNEPYLDWLQFILDKSDIPKTFSISYGDDEQTVPSDYATSVCNLFMQLGARGSSVLVSSGDFGVGAGDCVTNDGSKRKLFQPVFPASCPYITSVGGTTRIPETAVSFSGGGFSNYFSRPEYQRDSVLAYLTNLGANNAGLYNRTGRGYPDVAAQGTDFQVVLNGSVISVGGTSASAPTVAGVVSLLNDYLISHDGKPLGFLNPWLYSKAATGFNDITTGSNPGCSTKGFSAAKGWDPVTGLGTPDFEKLKGLCS